MQKRSLVFLFILTISLLLVNIFFKPAPTPNKSGKTTEQVQTSTIPAVTATQSFNEKFFTLENDYQQLVFSNIGGAIAEINLPIQSESHPKSLVLATEQEKNLEQSSSKHARFPAHNYTNLSQKNNEGQKGGYYPLIRRSVDPTVTNPRYYAFNIVSSNPTQALETYELKQHSNDQISFELNQKNRKITKTFSLDPTVPYGFKVDIKIDGEHPDLWITTGIPEIESATSQQTPALKYQAKKKNRLEIFKQSLPKQSAENRDLKPTWVSNSNGFFTLLVDPLTPMGEGYRVNKVIDKYVTSKIEDESSSKSKKQAGYEFLLPLSATSDETSLKVFAGPMENNVLKIAQGDNMPANYLGAQSYQGFLTFISEPCAKLLFMLMNVMHSITHSWGLAIILLTICLRIILYPLNSWSIRAMRKNQEIAPEVSAIQKQYKKNPKQAQIEIMSLYRKRKVNPLTGCLPLLIQMPFLIGMFNLLKSAFVLRGVSFIPGWIDNLTAPDTLFSWAYSIPIIGNEFHLLPVLSAIMIWVQQKMTNVTPIDKSLMTDQQKQQKMMGNVMILMVTVLCYSLPSGLNLYFISSTLLGILQQWITNRILDKKNKKPVILEKKSAALEN